MKDEANCQSTLKYFKRNGWVALREECEKFEKYGLDNFQLHKNTEFIAGVLRCLRILKQDFNNFQGNRIEYCLKF